MLSSFLLPLSPINIILSTNTTSQPLSQYNTKNVIKWYAPFSGRRGRLAYRWIVDPGLIKLSVFGVLKVAPSAHVRPPFVPIHAHLKCTSSVVVLLFTGGLGGRVLKIKWDILVLCQSALHFAERLFQFSLMYGQEFLISVFVCLSTCISPSTFTCSSLSFAPLSFPLSF